MAIFIGVKAIANYVGYSEGHTRLLIRQGKLPAYRRSTCLKKWIGNSVSLDKWIVNRDFKRAKRAAALAKRKHNSENYNRGFRLTEEIIDWLHSEREKTGDTLNEIVVRILLKEMNEVTNER